MPKSLCFMATDAWHSSPIAKTPEYQPLHFSRAYWASMMHPTRQINPMVEHIFAVDEDSPSTVCRNMIIGNSCIGIGENAPDETRVIGASGLANRVYIRWFCCKQGKRHATHRTISAAQDAPAFSDDAMTCESDWDAKVVQIFTRAGAVIRGRVACG